VINLASEVTRRARASADGAQSKMEVKQAEGDHLLRSLEAHPENTHDDVSCVTVMILSFYVNVGIASTFKLMSYDFILIWLSQNYITKQRTHKSSRLTLSLKLMIKRLKAEKNCYNCIVEVYYCRYN